MIYYEIISYRPASFKTEIEALDWRLDGIKKEDRTSEYYFEENHSDPVSNSSFTMGIMPYAERAWLIDNGKTTFIKNRQYGSAAKVDDNELVWITLSANPVTEWPGFKYL